MSNTIQEAEKNTYFQHYNFSVEELTSRDVEKKSLIKSSIYSGEELKVKALYIFTKTGKLARLASSFRPNIPIYAFSPFKTTV
jgi:pyruvate kinase